MNQPDPQFRLVMRGYDTAEVDRVLTGLNQRAVQAETAAAEAEAIAAEAKKTATKAEAAVADLQARLDQARAAAAEAEAAIPEPPTFEDLGERVGQILALAEEEAREMRDRAQAEAEEARKSADQAALAVRDDADRYAEQKRRDADTEGARILADARRAADEERDAAERDAAALRQEGQAIFEQQRASAAKAAADFETTLAERRDRTTAEFQEQQAATQAQIDAMMQRVEEARVAAQHEQETAEAQARQIVLDAEERAASLVNEARATADRIRTDSERELAAATQRRDSINAQLANVRQMLATLTGSTAGFPVDPLPGVAESPAAEEPQPDAENGERGEGAEQTDPDQT